MNRTYVVIEFGNPHFIDPCLIGKRIPFSFEDANISPQKLKCTILFPLRNKNCESMLERPINNLGVIPNSWGKVEYFEPNDIPSVNAVVVAVESENKVDLGCVKNSFFIYATKILKILRFIYPNSVTRYKTKKIINNIILQTSHNGRSCITGLEISMNIISDAPSRWIEFKGISLALKNLNKVPSLPLELYENALDYNSEGDYRTCVLNCAILIEMLMKRSLIRNINQLVHHQKLADKIIKEANGYDKIRKYLKELSLLPEICIEEVFNIRNRIMHTGYVPDKAEAFKALKISKDIISFYHVPLFE